MKNTFKIKILLLCALGFLLANSCTERFEELNTDPRIVTADIIDPGLILTYVEWRGLYCLAQTLFSLGTQGLNWLPGRL